MSPSVTAGNSDLEKILERINSIERRLQNLESLYKSGKISTEEFAKRSQEIMKNNDFNVEDMKNIMVTAGYMVRITDKISQPASFEVNENRWFDDANFIK